jgi:4,5-DOPA dioxygenase extradiol
MVHNLRTMTWEDTAYDWADDFDAELARCIATGDHQTLIDYPSLGPDARRAIPTNEHYLPLLYVLAMQGESDTLAFFCEKVTLGSISMRSILVA